MRVVTTAVVLVGGGGHARSVADVVRRLGGIVLAVVDPGDPEGWDVDVVSSLDVLAPEAAAVDHVVCLGDNGRRAVVLGELEVRGRRVGTVVAGSATFGGSAAVGAQVLEHAHVGPGASLARGAIVNTGAVVEHDVQVGECAHVAPGACVLGGATVGAGTLVGAGAIVLPGVRIGPGAVVGAGCVVVRDVAAGQLVRGVPGRVVLD